MKEIVIAKRQKKVVVPDGTEAFIIDKPLAQTGIAKKPVKNIQIIIGRNCRVKYIFLAGINNLSDSQNRELIIGDKSQVVSYRAYFGAGANDSKFVNSLGKEADFESRVLFYFSGHDSLTANDDYVFAKPGTQGRFSVVGLLNGEAIAKYYSNIIIKPLAQQTDSRIDMKLYLMSRTAKGVMLPGLKIDANEVKAGHGASTFQLSPEDIFYLQSRGLTEKQARELIINSLTARFTDGLPLKFKKEIDSEIKKKNRSK
ncbi:MAG: SufD family Fe-S cluster assembly protein [Candidatus Falkowbacteria bacterium]|nr:MAG: SufD family Fe-S cluster assembly protein [Candidatus Falkowbacteria bacterium]